METRSGKKSDGSGNQIETRLRDRDSGGPYGEQGGERQTPIFPPEWLAWWTQEQMKVTEEQRNLIGTLTAKLTEVVLRPEKKWGEAFQHFRLTKMGPADDPEAYLHAFEHVAAAAQWPREQWSTILFPYLTGDAQIAVDILPIGEARDYGKVKQTILSSLAISEDTYRRRMRSVVYQEAKGVRVTANAIRANGLRWIKPQERETEEILELIWLEQLYNSLPPKARTWVRCKEPRTLEEAVRVMEVFEEAIRSAQEETKKEDTDRGGGERGARVFPPKGARLPPSGRGRAVPAAVEQLREEQRELQRSGWSGLETRRSEETASQNRLFVARRGGGAFLQWPSTLVCFKCRTPGHVRRNCPQQIDAHDLAWSQSQVPPSKPLVIPIIVNGVKGEALLDSGCTQSLLREGWVPVRAKGPRVRLRCIHGDVRSYPTGEVTIEVKGSRRQVKVGVAKMLPYQAILGRDWPGLVQLAAEAGEKQKEEAIAEGIVGEEEDLRQLQLGDPTLREAWDQANRTGGKLGPGVRTEVREGLLYRVGVDPRTQEEVDQLVLPRGKRREALVMAHECPLAGHMREGATLQRLLARVYWPGIYNDVKSFCETCPTCQFTQPRGRPGGELRPLPIIDTPFERVAVDLVGPLPKGKGGYQYILVLIDYATRYPEAVALRSTKAPVLAAELLKIFTRVGLPREVLTDQGTNFMGEVMKEMWAQLGVKHLHTSVYHPQCNGLVERFNQTLKGMLRRFAIQEPREWPRYVEPVLFAVREVPQASTGFSPFELLFGRKPRGILDLAREHWEGQTGEGRTKKGTDIGALKERLQRLARWARQNLEKAQLEQKTTYDRRVKPREFKPGQEVLVLLPSTDVKLLARWQGPYKITRQVTPVDYEVEMHDKVVGKKVYHVNLLKEWKTREEMVAVVEELGPSRREILEPIGNIQVGEELRTDQREQLYRLQQDFPEVFSKTPGCTDLVQHRIVVKTPGVVRLAPRKWPRHWEETLKEEVELMLKMGVIEPSYSEWRSYPVLVPKPDGGVRVCIDFRKVNEVSSFDAYPMPRITGLLEKLGSARYLTTLDLTKGYWQIPLAPESRPYTAFATPLGLFQFRRMPFGLHGAAATFQRLVDRLLKEHAQYAAAYIDDIIIFSRTWEDHVRDIRRVIQTIKEAGLTVNPSKCKMGMVTTQYLGFTVGKGEVRPVISKVKAIKDVPPPASKKELQRFLGMVGYYRSFIPNFSQLAAPLTDTLKGKRSRIWVWDADCQHAFQLLKETLCQAPVLKSPDFTKPFKVMTDASAKGLGAVLAQEIKGQEHPIIYLSRKLTPTEQKYSTIERETLAVKWAVETLKYYLLGAPFELVTDHAPLTWLNRMKDTNARLTRWYLSLQPYKFSITYKKGSSHVNADFLSRQRNCGASAPMETAAPFSPGEACGEEGVSKGVVAEVFATGRVMQNMQGVYGAHPPPCTREIQNST